MGADEKDIRIEGPKKMAVIILNWNGLKLLQEYLPTASRYTIGNEIDLIVADNGSSDASVEWVRERHPEVKLLQFPENLGYAGGYNEALRQTRYRYTILLNSDVEVTPGWAETMLRLMEKNPGIGALQPKILWAKDKTMFEYAGAAGGLLDRLGYPYCRGRFFDKLEKDEGQYDEELTDVAWASGAAMCVDTELYLRLGGLDERFFAHMEEIDLCCRIIASGRRVCATGLAKVYHLGGGTLPQGNSKKVYLNFRNNLLLLHKNLPEKKGKKVLFVRRLADTLAFLMFVVKGSWGDAKAVLKAHGDFRKMRKLYTDLPQEDRLSTLPGAKRLIVLERFLLRKTLPGSDRKGGR